MNRLVVFAALGLLAGTGCAAEQHLTASHGRSARTAFARQCATPPDVTPAQALTGLDSQEAAIVSDGYRRSLAPRGQRVEEEPIVFVAPAPQGSTRPVLPPPSVPKNN